MLPREAPPEWRGFMSGMEDTGGGASLSVCVWESNEIYAPGLHFGVLSAQRGSSFCGARALSSVVLPIGLLEDGRSTVGGAAECAGGGTVLPREAPPEGRGFMSGMEDTGGGASRRVCICERDASSEAGVSL